MEHNIDKHNVAEIYIVPTNYNTNNLFEIWDLFFHMVTLLPIEYFSIPTPDNQIFKVNTMGNGRNLLSTTIDKFNEKTSFMICTYYLDEKNTSTSINHFSLFENGRYLDHLAVTRLCFKDKLCNQTAIKPLYQWQLEKNKDKLSSNDYLAWQNYFSQAEAELSDKFKGIILLHI